MIFRTPNHNVFSGVLALLLTISIQSSALSNGAGNQRNCAPADLDGSLTKVSNNAVRFASFNAFLNRASPGQLIADLKRGDNGQIQAVAEIIQRTRPDVLLINEFDYDEAKLAADLFRTNYLQVKQNDQATIDYPYAYLAESNTGLLSGVDLNNDGSVGWPGDAFGYGLFPGQFAMVLYSKFPIVEHKVRTFQKFLWKDMPNSMLPTEYYSSKAQSVFRLSSKSHWDVPLRINNSTVHVLAAHPTPPIFDGPEDRNGRRNHDEIRFWADYVSARKHATYIYDDEGKKGGLSQKEAFVIMGDYNADPNDGDSTDRAILQLLNHSAIDARRSPASLGGEDDAKREGGANAMHVGHPALDTGDFNSSGPGNLRVDYVLPSKRGLKTQCGGVFWPKASDATRYLVGDGVPVVSSDHRLVWQDLVIEFGK